MKPGDLIISNCDNHQYPPGLILSEYSGFISFQLTVETGFNVLWLFNNGESKCSTSYLNAHYEVCNHI